MFCMPPTFRARVIVLTRTHREDASRGVLANSARRSLRLWQPV